MEELIGIKLPDGSVKLVKRDSDEARNNENLPGVTNKQSLYKYRLDTEAKLTDAEEQNLETLADTKVKKSRILSKKSVSGGGGGMDSKFQIYVPDETEEYEAFPWEELVKGNVTKEDARRAWIDQERAKLIQKKSDDVLHDMENDLRPWYMDIWNVVRKGQPGVSGYMPDEYEMTRMALSASYKADYEKLAGIYDDDGNLLEDGAIAKKIHGIKNRKSLIENLHYQISQIEQTPQDQITQDMVNQHSALLKQYRAHAKVFELDIEQLNSMNVEAKTLSELADLSKRSHNELDVAVMKITKTSLNALSGLSQLSAELSYGGIAKNVLGIDFNDPEDQEMIPEFLRPWTDIQGAQYKTLDNVAEYLGDAATEIGGHARKNIQLGEIENLGDFGVFMLDLFSEQAVNTAVTLSTGGAGLLLIAGGAAGNKMTEMNYLMDNGEKINGWQYYGAGLGYGLAEYVTERVSLGQAKGMVKALGSDFTKKNFKKAFLNQTQKEAFDMTTELGGKYTLRTMNFGKAFKRYAVNVNQEGSAEMFATLGQNFIDKYVLKNDDVDMLDGVGTAYLTGALMSGMGFQAPVITKDLYQAFTQKATWGKINSNTFEIIELDQEIKNLELKPKTPSRDTAIKELRKKQDELLRFNLNAKTETEDRVSAMKPEQRRRTIDIMMGINKKKGAIDRINSRTDLNQITKTKMINGIIAEINNLESQHQLVLNQAQLENDDIKNSELAREAAILTGKNINVVKGRGVDNLFEEGINAIEKSGLSKEEITEAKDRLTKTIKDVKNSEGTIHGFTMNFGNQSFTFQDLINSEAAGYGNASVFSHELSHATLFKSIIEQGGDLTQMADMLVDYIGSRYKGLTAKVKDDSAYQDMNNAERAEEKLARAIDFMRKYDLKADRTLTGSMLDGWKKLTGRSDQYNEVKTGEDVFNLLRSFSDSFKTGKLETFTKRVLKGEVKLAQANQRVQEEQAKEGVKFSMGREQLYDATERLIGVTPELKSEFAKGEEYLLEKGIIKKVKDKKGKLVNRWTGFDQTKAMEAGFGWRNEVERRFKKYEKFSDYGKHIEDMVSDVAYGDVEGARGIVDIIRRWDPSTTPDIAKWINGQLDVKIDGVRQKYGVGLGFKVSLGDFTPDEIDNIINDNNFVLNQNKSNVDKLDTETKTKIRLKEELTSDIAVEIDAAVKALNIDPKGKNFKELKDATPNQTQKMFGIVPKPGNLTKGDITNSQEFIEENVDVLMSMLPNGATAAGTSTGVQQVLLDKFYTKGEAATMKKTGSRAGLDMQVKNPIPERYTIKQVKNEKGELVQQKVESDAYKAYKKDFLEYFGIIEDGTNLYKKETNVSARIKALVAQTGKMLTNQAVRDQQLEQGKSVDALKFIADGKNEVMFSKTIRNLSNTKMEVAVGIIDKLRTLDLSPNDMQNLTATMAGHLAEFNITVKQKDNIIKDLQDIWKKFSKFKPSDLAANLTATEAFKQEVIRQSGLDPDSPLSFKGINGYNGLTGSKLFDKAGIESSRAQLASMLADGTITKAEFRFFFGGMSLASKLGNGQYIPTDLGSTTVVENTKWKKGGQRYGLFANKADLNAFIEKHGKVDGNDMGTPSATVYDLHRKNRLPSESEIETAVKESKDNNKFLGTLADRLRKRFREGKITESQIAALIQTMNNNPGSLLRTSGILDYMQVRLTAGNIDLEHMTPAKDIGLSMFEYITGKGRDTSGFKDKLNGYRTALISKNAHKTINKFYKDFMPTWWDGTMMSLIRYYNPLTAGKFNVKLKQISTGNIIGPEIIKDKKAYELAEANNLKVLKATGVMKFSKSLSKQEIIDKLNLVDKALELARKKNKERKGISILDFDDTLATTNSEIIVNLKDGTQVKWTPAEFAKKAETSADLVESYDFSEFNEVKGGKPGPFLKRALELQEKFGSNDIFILTARPQAAALPIQTFLKGVGLNVKLENITGLEDGSPLAKADFVVQRAAEGYNDFLFADDALGNVEAVKTVLDVIDIKSDVQQVMFSRNLSKDFNEMIEIKKGVSRDAVYSDAVAKIKGGKIGQFTFYLPPSAEDFMGLMYNFIGKGKTGDAQLKWFNDNIMRPYYRGVEAMNVAKQGVQDGYKSLRKQYPDVKKLLNKEIPGSILTHEQAIRVYLWNKSGHKIEGLTKRDLAAVNKAMKNNPNLQLFAESLMPIIKQTEYVEPGSSWIAGSILSDLNDVNSNIGRKQFLQEFEQNIDEVFTKENLNKIEALYGTPMREAIEDSIYRMKTGRNRSWGQGNRLMNEFQDWINNSVGATMFINMRSATLQSLSTVNFMNWSDNNPLAAARAWANQPQFWKDFSTIWNSPKLRQRRGGLQLNIQESEMAAAAKKGGVKGVIAELLRLGFTPTRMVDSLAISMGGATMYRNRIKKYKKEGYSTKEAEARAWEDFSRISEETQQSSDPSLISKVQASPLGRFIFAWQNTPFQYNRLMKKAGRDLINGRGDAKTHVSKILYYGMVQNFIFASMQNALFALLPGMHGDEDEDQEKQAKKEEGMVLRTVNNMADTILRGSGLPGAVVSTVKNLIMEYREQDAKGFTADHAYTLIEMVNISPPLGSKVRKMYNAIQTKRFEQDVIDARGFNLDSPMYSVIGNLVEATTNVPLARAVNIATNTYAALDARHQLWQRIAMAMGWNTWNVGVEPFPEHDTIKDQAKERRKQEGIEKRKQTNAEFQHYKKIIESNMPKAYYKNYKKLPLKERNQIIRDEIQRLKNRENE